MTEGQEGVYYCLDPDRGPLSLSFSWFFWLQENRKVGPRLTAASVGSQLSIANYELGWGHFLFFSKPNRNSQLREFSHFLRAPGAPFWAWGSGCVCLWVLLSFLNSYSQSPCPQKWLGVAGESPHVWPWSRTGSHVLEEDLILVGMAGTGQHLLGAQLHPERTFLATLCMTTAAAWVFPYILRVTLMVGRAFWWSSSLTTHQ